jgi:hypothetical protein
MICEPQPMSNPNDLSMICEPQPMSKTRLRSLCHSPH